MHRLHLLGATVLATLLVTPAATQTRDLTFRDRVDAQRAIERVYYSHQTGATLPFEEAVPEAVLERKVRTYLKQSVALGRFWGTPISAAALQAEWQRIARSSRFPERLAEIYAALDRDPVLFQETFVRSVLADRLSRSFLKMDQRIHARSRREIEVLHERLETGALRVASEEPRRTVWELVRIGDEAAREGSPGKGEPGARVSSLKVEPAEFEQWRSSIPSRIGEIGKIQDEEEAWSIRVLLAENPGRSVQIARYAVPKVGWAEWWQQTKEEWDDGSIATVAQPTQVPTTGSWNVPLAFHPTPASVCTPADTWDNGILDAAPRPMSNHPAVWTGSLMVVWGGTSERTPTGLGARYDPLTDTWSATATAGAPSPRLNATAVWTGQEMIVWGGSNGGGVGYVNTGGRYNPATDTWASTSTAGAPGARDGHTAVWTGNRMVIFGGGGAGGEFATGSRYDPATDTWAATSTAGVPSARGRHSAIWTGSRMVIWGGVGGTPLNSGGLYDPVADTWSITSTVNAPSGRSFHSAIWTGTRMVVWGGMAGSGSILFNTGGVYDPVGNTWEGVSTTNAPSARYTHRAIWTGSRMVVWGGGSDTGGRYDPAADTWSATSTLNAPAARADHSAVWTGDRMIVWGGYTPDAFQLNTGGQYNPASDTWTPTSSTGEVSPRSMHTGVWTGNEMIIWGGGGNTRVNTGGRYNPVSDSWTPTTTVGAPAARGDHTAVWTGNEMIVWGGSGLSFPLGGGRYNPILDSWSSMTSLNQPTEKTFATAIWTGNEMIVWGGGEIVTFGTGGRYNPATDTWIATSPGPVRRSGHSAVWTGTRMIVWGGNGGASFGFQNTGGQYDPGTNSWTPTSTGNAPSALSNHSAVWTGDRMIIWGGAASPSGSSYVNTGAWYDPATDTWAPISTTGAPSARAYHSGVWAGNHMVIYGGLGPGIVPFDTGGRYNPMADSWSATSLVHAPSPRDRHTTISTGDFMMVWGGLSRLGPFSLLSSGGRYAPLGSGFDEDADGFTACTGDCDDSNASVHPGAPELCDGLDNNCNDVVDEVVDLDGDGFTNCGGDCNDSNPAVHPGAVEVCNGVDDDCDAAVDEGMADSDGDGFDGCTDCNDSVASVHPGAVELCNGVDDNCTGMVDEGFPDQDGDGSADCVDCQDANPSVNPGATEVCNQIDDNCNDLIDEGFDQDGDGVTQCLGDCNDADPEVWDFPVEVIDLNVGSGIPTPIDWFDLGPFLGPGTTYDLVSGTLAGGGLNLPSAVCLQSAGGNSYSDNRPDPVSGSGYWYLSRARNSCGIGTYGFSSTGSERSIPTCP